MAKTAPTSKRGEIARLAKQIADHQARIQVIAANWGAELNDVLTASERALLAKLSKLLKNFEFHPNALKTLSDLRKICRELTAIRQAAYARAEKKITAEAGALAENESKWAKRVSKELSEPGTKFAAPSAAALDKVVKFGLASGATMSEYFSKVAADDALRIESTIRQGVESGWTIDQMARNIAGSAANDYKDGIFETSRRSAVNMARTLTNAIANNAKETFYRENADVLEGVEILATLDGRTCPVCASVDRVRYKFDEPHPALPIHHQCRCVLLPVTPLSDLVEESRPMAKADFMKEAERLYQKKYPNKDFAALADSTKKKYYYEAMREYERITGEPAYTQVSGGVSFREYFEKHMTAQQQRDWLGPERYEIWKRGNLSVDKFIPPYPNPRLTVEALKELDKQSFVAAG
jgi:SPP1 gp7 family putative phage head morphogenesis protein